MGSIKNAFKSIFSPTASRTTGILVILIIAAAVPLTVFVSQKQQELRQHAEGLQCSQCKATCDSQEDVTGCLNLCEQTYSADCKIPSNSPTSAPTKFKLTNQYVNPKDADVTPGSQTADCAVSTDCVGGYGGCFKQGFLSQIFICSAGNKWDSCNTDSICKQEVVGSTTYYCTKDGPWSNIKPAECTTAPTAVPAVPTAVPAAPASQTVPPPTTPSGCPLKSKGDANCDNKVNILDYNIWRDEINKRFTTLFADFDGNKDIGRNDRDIWQQSMKDASVPH